MNKPLSSGRQDLIDRMESRGASEAEIHNQLIEWQHQDQGLPFTAIPIQELTRENLATAIAQTLEQKVKNEKATSQSEKRSDDLFVGDADE